MREKIIHSQMIVLVTLIATLNIHGWDKDKQDAQI